MSEKLLLNVAKGALLTLSVGSLGAIYIIFKNIKPSEINRCKYSIAYSSQPFF